MRALLLHTNRFETKIIEESNKPDSIEPEKLSSGGEKMSEGITCFFTVEEGDDIGILDELLAEIIKMAKETGSSRLMISPFVHLSDTIAKPETAKMFYESLLEKFTGSDYEIHSSHFGYHKSLLLDVMGHPGSFRFRHF